MAYIVTYQSRFIQRNEALINAVRSYQRWAVLTDWSYLIAQNETTTEGVRDHLIRFCKPGDKIFVAELKRNAAWTGLPDNVSSWIQSNL